MRRTKTKWQQTPKGPKARSAPIIQFNWRRQWSKKVAPCLNEELVQQSLDLGMMMCDRNWKRGDAPCDVGALGINRIVDGKIRFNRIVEGKLSWYQPLNECHHIAFFSMAIGVLNYPELDWRFVFGDRHSVPVGYDANGNPRVVIDILLYAFQDAEQSIALAKEDLPRLKPNPEAQKQWDTIIELFLANKVPALKKRAQELRKSR